MPVLYYQHAYFNLNGYNSSILNHTVEIKSDKILVLDEDSIPTGEVRDIKALLLTSILQRKSALIL